MVQLLSNPCRPIWHEQLKLEALKHLQLGLVCSYFSELVKEIYGFILFVFCQFAVNHHSFKDVGFYQVCIYLFYICKILPVNLFAITFVEEIQFIAEQEPFCKTKSYTIVSFCISPGNRCRPDKTNVGVPLVIGNIIRKFFLTTGNAV